ncbi:imidazolonepropionase [Caldivirga sp.]|uniref:imidazolonepropionase n=1 Tax=Caldivirga sp. TaxID=2080243 RepID=UPI003D0C6294
MPWRFNDNVLIINDAGLIINNGFITDVGPWDLLRSRYEYDRIINAEDSLVTAGLVDPHTHLLFAGSREDELELKLNGVSYEDILKRGGGIRRTIEATVKADDKELVKVGLSRLTQALSYGTTTIEVKSGYGLSIDQEIRLLRLINDLKNRIEVDIVVTFLAHVPLGNGREGYVRDIVNSMSKIRDLATFADVFCDSEAFTANESKVILEAAYNAGLGLRMHADELSYIGCSDLARELELTSIDHLLNTPEGNIKVMAVRGITATLLPITVLTLMTNKRPLVNVMRSSRAITAIGTDFSPNTWSISMQTAMELSSYLLGLTPMEALMAATVNSAYSLGLRDRGVLMPGYLADVVIWNVPNYRWLTYSIGANKVKAIVKRGKVITGDCLS